MYGKSVLVLLTLVSVEGLLASHASDTRVIGGLDGEAKYLALFKMDNGERCGGAIVKEDKILTTGSCCKMIDKSKTTVIAGLNELIDQIPEDNKNTVEKKIFFEGDGYTLDSNICIVKLTKLFDLDLPNIEKIGHATDAKEPTGKLTFFGWGSTDASNPYEYLDKLKKVDLDVKKIEDCKKEYPDVTDNMMCTYTKDKGFCAGDKGGPLVKDNKVFGLAAWGAGCVSDKPHVYTLVGAEKFKKWLDKNLK